MSPECLKGLYYEESSDVFSYGIILCEIIARVEADPDQLPRTDNFGLDYMAFCELCDPNVVPEFLKLAFKCCTIDPQSRPKFTEIVDVLTGILRDVRQASCVAAKSVEQLDVTSGTVSAPQHRKSKHCLTILIRNSNIFPNLTETF